MNPVVPARILPVIVFSQFAGTSLWFAANAVMPDLQLDWALPTSAIGRLTSSVQIGFVAGTLVFALLMLADRCRPTRLFLACATAGAMANAVATVLPPGAWGALLLSRFAVGFLLAGVYPVGMRIAASWYRDGLGAAMGLLIGALVLGTALPYALRAMQWGGNGVMLPWRSVLIGVSLLALAGGLATALLVPEPPRAATAPPKLSARGLGVIWTDRQVRASVFGYFGHMWELYTFYVLVPFILAIRLATTAVSAAAFWVIAGGVLGCVVGGAMARRVGSARIAAIQLATSGACGLVSPLMLRAPLPVFMAWLLLWGITVVGDSPQFSALTARNAPPRLVGSVLTFTNCIGFGITVVSIELFVLGTRQLPLSLLLPGLALGPAIGLWMLRPLLGRQSAGTRGG